MAVEKEVWKNISAGKHWVKKYNRYGEEESEMVGAGKTIQLTTEERQLNQERASSKKWDMFSNGILQPVKLLDGTEKAELESNPNFLGESDLLALFELQWKAFEKKVEAIDSPIVLQRLHDLTVNDDDLATARQVKIIEAGLERTAGVRKVLPSGVEDAEVKITAVSPR